MLPLKAIKYQQQEQPYKLYPFNLPIFQHLTEITFNEPVTILVGDNGTGKSTILETIALSGEMITIGGNKMETNFSQVVLRQMKLSWSIKSNKGFYFKAQDFIQFIERIKEAKKDSLEAIEEIKASNIDPMAIMPHARTLYDLNHFYGDGLEFRSHGESFLDLFQARFRAGGLYVLDEPEAPLSPINQLAFLSLMKQMIKENAQFIIATHSPLLMAFPNANILLLDGEELKPVRYEELEHVTLTRDFLNNPESFLRHL